MSNNSRIRSLTDVNGRLKLGDGGVTIDGSKITGDPVLQITQSGANLVLSTPGGLVNISGSPSTGDSGTAVLVAGTVTVADTSVTASSIVLLSRKAIGGTTGMLTFSVNAGVGFTITSSSNTDTSTIAYVRFG